jgi:hypothetical protein
MTHDAQDWEVPWAGKALQNRWATAPPLLARARAEDRGEIEAAAESRDEKTALEEKEAEWEQRKKRRVVKGTDRVLAAFKTAASGSSIDLSMFTSNFLLFPQAASPSFTSGAILSTAGAVLPAGVLESFVFASSSSVLALKSTPLPNVMTVDSAVDIWSAGLTKCPLNFSEPIVTWTADTPRSVSAVYVAMNLLPTPLLFSTSKMLWSAFPAGDPSAPTSLEQNVCLMDHKMLSLGLVSTTDNSFDVLKTLKLSSLTNDPIQMRSVLSLLGPKWMKDLLGNDIPGFSQDDASQMFSLTIDATQGSRSMLTFSPLLNSPTWLRLQFNFSERADHKTIIDHFNETFSQFLGATAGISDIRLVTTTRVNTVVSAGDAQFNTSSEVMLHATLLLGSLKFGVYITFGPKTTTFVLRFHEGQSPLAAIPDGLLHPSLTTNGSVHPDQTNPTVLMPDQSEDDDGGKKFDISLREITLKLQNASKNTSFAMISASVTFEVEVLQTKFIATVSKPLALRLSLWKFYPDAAHDNRVLAYFEDSAQLMPRGGKGAATTSLTSLMPNATQDDVSRPGWIGLTITAAQFFVTRDETAKEVYLSFSGALQSRVNRSSVPCFSFDYLAVNASCTRSEDSNHISWDVSIDAAATLRPRNFDYEPVQMSGSVAVNDDGDGGMLWLIQGHVQNLNFASMYSMLDQDSSHGILDLLEHLEISFLDISYNFKSTKPPKGSSQPKKQEWTLKVNGGLMIGNMELDMVYSNDNTGTWSIDAGVGSVSTDMTLKNLISNMIPSSTSELHTALDEVPFIGSITFPKTEVGAQPDTMPVELKVWKGQKGLHMFFKIEVETPVGGVNFLFIQFTPKQPKESGGQTNDGDSEAKDVTKDNSESAGDDHPSGGKHIKRIIRVRISKLPTLPDLPIVGHIGQPIDSLDYLYVSDPAAKDDDITSGFTKTEIADINKVTYLFCVSCS